MIHCVVPENIHTNPTDGNSEGSERDKFLKGRGFEM